MSFCFRPISLLVFESLTPVLLVNRNSSSSKAMQTTLQLAAVLMVDFLDQLFSAEKLKSQKACITVTRFFIRTLSGVISAYKDELNKMDIALPIKNDCLVFYETLDKHFQQFLQFLDTDCDALFDNQAPAKNKEVFETGLSVSQLAIYLRLQVDTGIIKTDNNQRTVNQACRCFKTTRSNSLSPESLYNKFYSPDPAAVSIMRTHLVNMLNQLKKY